MSEDIEDLKVNKIVRHDEQGHVGLGVYGQPMLDELGENEGVSEAVGGRGEAPAEPIDREAIRTRVVDTLKSIYDPEIPVNIYDLGLIYGFEVADDGTVDIDMTLTAPGCPVAGMIVEEVAQKTGAIDGVRTSHVKLTWDPPWTRDRMTEEAMLELGLL